MAADRGEWDVHVDWEGRRLGRLADRVLRPLRSLRTRRRERALAREHDEVRRRDRGEPARDRWWDTGGGPVALDEMGLFLLVLTALVVGVVLVLVVVAVLVAGALEVLAVVVVVAGVFTWRTLARRPWRVVATDGAVEHAWEVVGWRRARRLVRAVDAGLQAGAAPATIEPDRRVVPGDRAV